MALISAVALFVPVSSLLVTHWQNHLWDLGHTILFFLWSWFGLKTLSRKGLGNTTSATLIIVATTIIGGIVEILQMSLSRDASAHDLVLDLCGSVIAAGIWNAALQSRQPPLHPKHYLRITGLAAVAVAALLLAVQPLCKSLYDRYLANRQFPVLISGNSDLELNRLYGKPEKSFVAAVDPVEHPKGGIGIRFTTARYSLVYLYGFPSDWSGYQTLEVSLYVPEASSFAAILSVEDESHRDNGTRYHDRFNLELNLTAGSNRIIIPLEDIQNAPRTRLLDLTRITRLNLYTMALPQERTVYLTGLRLNP